VFAAENEIPEAFKSEYIAFYKKDAAKYTFPSQSVWKAYLEDIKTKPNVHPYEGFLKISKDKNMFNELESENSISSVAQFSSVGHNVQPDESGSDLVELDAEQAANQAGQQAVNQLCDGEEVDERSINQGSGATKKNGAVAPILNADENADENLRL
jgi:hypothetical protein